jgi:hypothetical protein
MDVAIGHFTQMGYPEADIRSIVEQLIEVPFFIWSHLHPPVLSSGFKNRGHGPEDTSSCDSSL